MNCPHCSKSIDPALITAARQSDLGKRSRPGAKGLVRNPKGRPARKKEAKLVEVNQSAIESKLFKQALRRFFISGADPMGQHKTAADLAFSMQFEIDLWNEGQDCELQNARDVAKAKRYVAEFGA